MKSRWTIFFGKDLLRSIRQTNDTARLSKIFAPSLWKRTRRFWTRPNSDTFFIFATVYYIPKTMTIETDWLFLSTSFLNFYKIYTTTSIISVEILYCKTWRDYISETEYIECANILSHIIFIEPTERTISYLSGVSNRFNLLCSLYIRSV